MTRSSTPQRAPGRSRSLGVAAVALLAALLSTLFAAPAMALPPGGPNEQRGGATLKVTSTFVAAPDPAVPTSGVVSFTGQGFAAGEVLVVKVDDGDVRPATVPPTPPGGVPNATDGFAWVTANGEGAIQGTVDLKQTRTADARKVAQGKHHLRLISSTPRSIHADFVVATRTTGPTQARGASAAFVGPGADQPVSWLPGDQPFSDIPTLIPGSLIPYRVSGYPAGQTVSIKVDNGGEGNPMNPPTPRVDPLTGGNLPADVWHRFVVGPDGTASGVFEGPVDVTGGGHLLRFLGARTTTDAAPADNTSHWAPFAFSRCVSSRSVDVSTTAPQGGQLEISGSGLLKTSFYLNGGPGNTGDGQTVGVRVGDGDVQFLRAANSGHLTGTGAVPADAPVGSEVPVTVFVGFRAGSDFPQAVLRTSFRVTASGTATGPLPPPRPVNALPIECDPNPQPPTEPPSTETPQTPIVPPPGPPLFPAPTPTPTPERGARVASTSLKATKNRITLKLRRGSVARKVAVTVRTKAKVRVGTRKRIVTLAKATSTVKAGTAKQSATVKLQLTAEGRALLKRVTKVRVVVRVAPTGKGGKAATRTVWLRG
jgi:hypothetical protein